MELLFKTITSAEDINELSILAEKIWNAHYPSIIGQKQTDYMLDKFYTPENISDQINNNNVFSGAYLNKELIAFISVSKSDKTDYIIHKLYVNTDLHRQGIGKAIFNHVFEQKKLIANSSFTIRLTVNRQNYKAINFYFKLGFCIEKVTDMDIGSGFVMNDFIMIYKWKD